MWRIDLRISFSFYGQRDSANILTFFCQFTMNSTTHCVILGELGLLGWNPEPSQCWTNMLSLVFQFLNRAQSGHSPPPPPPRPPAILTFSPWREVLLDSIVEADPEWGKADLPLNASRQTAVQFRQPFCFCQGGDGPQDTFIPNGTRVLAFTLDLEMRKVQVRGKWLSIKEGVMPGED